MAYSIEPAYLVQNELTRLIIKAGTDPVNKWFFTDGAFTPDSQLERTPNTWMHENFVVIENKQVLAYFEAFWNKPLNIITSFRMIFFEKDKANTIVKALFQYAEAAANKFNWLELNPKLKVAIYKTTKSL